MFNLVIIRELVIAALWAGVMAGLLLTAAQQIQIIPNLLQTEMYDGSTAATVVANLGNGHAPYDWQPEYLERAFFNIIANISLGVGFALLIGSIMCLCGRPGSWRTGLLWGLAGYIIFFAAPSLGLPPEIPGTETSKLADWQSWWLIAVLDTGFGLSLLAFAQTWTNKFFGAVLLAAPHLISAPQPEVNSSTAPAELPQFFYSRHCFCQRCLLAGPWRFNGTLLQKEIMRTHDKHVLMCTDLRCAENSTEAFQQLGQKIDARPQLKVKRTRSSCFAICKNGPILVVYPEGVWYSCTDESVLERIVSEHLENNIEVSEHVIHRLGIGDV